MKQKPKTKAKLKAKLKAKPLVYLKVDKSFAELEQAEDKKIQTIGDLFAENCDLSKSLIKKLMNLGAAWLHRGGKRLRVRRFTKEIMPNDTLELYYDKRLLEIDLSHDLPVLLHHNSRAHFSVWYKPPAWLAQGTDVGDEWSLLRYAEKTMVMANSPLPGEKGVYLIHRLDREVAGLMVVAHTSKAAARISDDFQKRHVDKQYLALVSYEDAEKPVETQTISEPLEAKEAITHVKVIEHFPDRKQSLVLINLETGRFHQIRKHLHMKGFPILNEGKRCEEFPLYLFAMSLTVDGKRFLLPKDHWPSHLLSLQEFAKNDLEKYFATCDQNKG